MGLEITGVRTETVTSGITHVAGIDDLTGEKVILTLESAVTYIRKGGDVYTTYDGRRTQVHVVESEPPFIRTDANDSTDDNLLSQPPF